MALTEYDRLNDAVKRKKAAALGDIEEAAGMQVAQASPPNIGGLAGKRQNAIDAAEKAAVSPAAPKAAAPAAPDVDPDKAIGISIPKYVPPKPVEKPGLLKRIFGDAGEDAAPALGAAAAAGTAMVPYNAVTGQAPGVPKPPLEPMKTYPDLAKAARAKDAAAYAAQAANAASPAAAAAEPVAAKAASETARLGERAAGAANKVLDMPGKVAAGAKALGPALARGGAAAAGIAGALEGYGTSTEDYRKRLGMGPNAQSALGGALAGAGFENAGRFVDDLGTRAVGVATDVANAAAFNQLGRFFADKKDAPATAQPAVPGAQPAAGEPAGPPASLAGPTAAVGAPARVDQRVIDDEKRTELIRGEKAPPPNGVALGDFGVPGTEIVGRSTRPDGKINDFSGTGTGAAPQGNGVTLGLTAADIAADKANTMRRLAIGRTPDAPTFQNSKAVVDGLNKLQDLAAKMQSPAISRKERKALQAQIAVLNANVARFNDVDRTNFAAAEAAHRSALGQYNAAGAAFDQRAALGLKSATDFMAAQAEAIKARNAAMKDASEAAGAREKEEYARRGDRAKTMDTTIDNAVKGGLIPGVGAADQERAAAALKALARTKPITIPGPDGKPKKATFADLPDAEQAQHLTTLVEQLRPNLGKAGFIRNAPSMTGQNQPMTESTLGQKFNYIAGAPTELGRVGDAFNPFTPKLLTDNEGNFILGDTSPEEKYRYDSRKKRQ